MTPTAITDQKGESHCNDNAGKDEYQCNNNEKEDISHCNNNERVVEPHCNNKTKIAETIMSFLKVKTYAWIPLALVVIFACMYYYTPTNPPPCTSTSVDSTTLAATAAGKLSLEERYQLQQRRLEADDMQCTPRQEKRQLHEVLVISDADPLYRHIDQNQMIVATVCHEHYFSYCDHPYKCKTDRTECETVVANLKFLKGQPNPWNTTKIEVSIRKVVSCSCQEVTGDERNYPKGSFPLRTCSDGSIHTKDWGNKKDNDDDDVIRTSSVPGSATVF